MTEAEEAAYMRGQRAVWASLAAQAGRELDRASEEGKAAVLIAEREMAIVVLRRLCEEYGDVEWDEHLHLADIIDKHLGRHLDEEETSEPDADVLAERERCATWARRYANGDGADTTYAEAILRKIESGEVPPET